MVGAASEVVGTSFAVLPATNYDTDVSTGAGAVNSM
jgi:hypothetical protein